jgi:tetratricopeptide (TPR) repeat protein
LKRYDAFLSYNSKDSSAVQQLARRLRTEKLALYLDESELAPGREFQPALAKALHQSKTCVVFLGPNGVSPWQSEELQVAIDKRTREPDFHVIPVLLPGAERPRRGDVAHLDFLINASWVEFVKTLDDNRVFQKLVWGITGTKRSENQLLREEICPYRGLETFRTEDARFFFGRENLTGWLVSALRREIRTAEGVRFLGLLGPSGSGKSSVILAGLVPQIQTGAIEGSERWRVAVMRPGDDPIKNLVIGVMPQLLPSGTIPLSSQALKLIDDLHADARTFDIFTQMALHDQSNDVRLVVVVDQFEEVFTYRPQDEQRRSRFEKARAAFFANLLHAATTPAGRVAVVVTMRSDFLSACAMFPQLAAVLSAHAELVGPMTAEELREAIEKPAFLCGCEVDPALTERLLAAVERQSGALPLLQFALTEAWKKRDVCRLTLQTYNQLGGLEGAVERRANEIYSNLSEEDQDLCRWLYLQLVQLGEGTEDTKRRVPFRDLLPADPARAESIHKLIQTLSHPDARLLTTEAVDASDAVDQYEGVVEVSHEALIRGWPKLQKWLGDEREGLRIQRQLSAAARDWADAEPEQKNGFLYSSVRLAACGEWVETHRHELTQMQVAFLRASEEAEKQRRQDELELKQIALEKERRLREEADHQAEVAEESLKFVELALRPADPNSSANRDITLRETLDLMAQKLCQGELASELKTPESSVQIRIVIGKLYFNLGEYSLSRDFFLQAHRLASEKLGKTDRRSMTALDQLGQAYIYLDDLKNAEDALTEAYELQRETLGQEDEDTIHSYAKLATVYRKRNELERALEIETDVLEVRRRLWGDDYEFTLVSLNQLGLVNIELQRPEEALPLFEKAERAAKQTLPKDHISTLVYLHNRALACMKLNCFEESLVLYKECLSKKQEKFGLNHPEALKTELAITDVKFQAGHVEEAQEQLISIQERLALGSESQNVTRALLLLKLGKCAVALKNYSEANDKLTSADNLLMKTVGPNHKLTTEVAEALRELHRAEELDDSDKC